MAKFTPANFLVIGHLNSDKDVNIGEYSSLVHPFMNITPDSFKFLESSMDFYSTRYKIRVYFGHIINDKPLTDINEYDPPSERSGEIYNHYANDIFIIRPSYHKDNNGNIQIEGKSKCVYVINKKDNDINNDVNNKTFTPIPIFDKNTTDKNITSKKDFEKCLLSNNEQNIGEIKVAPWPLNDKSYPDGIILKSNNEYYFYPHINKQRIIIKGKAISNKISECVSYNVKYNDIRPQALTKSTLKNDSAIIYQHQIAFMDLHIVNRFNGNDKFNRKDFNNIVNDITKNAAEETLSEGTSLYSPINAFKKIVNMDTNYNDKSHNTNIDSDKDETIHSDDNTGIDNENISTQSNQGNKSIKFENQVNDNMNQQNNKDTFSNNIDFIHKLEHLAYINKPRLYYNKQDLINFHTAMKCDGLVVLAGLSGTGKSALINLYAKALGIDKSNQYKFIPVRPFWNDDSDLLGYVDTVHSIYQPADSGLVNTLVEASKNSNHLYLITFDEMNLARVEYYFSQFLSILEENSDKRYIQLYNPDLESRLYNSNKYPARIKIGNNVLFAGTINLDESTHKFSDKVLDRSNIINLKLLPYYKDISYTDVKPSDNILTKTISNDDFQNMKNCNPLNKMTADDLKLLWKLHLVLHNANNNLGIGRRIINQINQFLCNIPKGTDMLINHGNALDLQLVQRVFTKVRGSNTDIGSILNPNSDNTNNLINILRDNSNISKFTRSIHELKRKYQEITDYGFTI